MKSLSTIFTESLAQLSENGPRDGYLKFAKGKPNSLTIKEKQWFNISFPIMQSYSDTKRLTAFIIGDTPGHRKFVIEINDKRSELYVDLEKKVATFKYYYKDEVLVDDLVKELKKSLRDIKVTSEEK